MKYRGNDVPLYGSKYRVIAKLMGYDGTWSGANYRTFYIRSHQRKDVFQAVAAVVFTTLEPGKDFAWVEYIAYQSITERKTGEGLKG